MVVRKGTRLYLQDRGTSTPAPTNDIIEPYNVEYNRPIDTKRRQDEVDALEALTSMVFDHTGSEEDQM